MQVGKREVEEIREEARGVAAVPVEIDSTMSVRKQIDASQAVMTKLLAVFVGCEINDGLFKITAVARKLCELEKTTGDTQCSCVGRYIRRHLLPKVARGKQMTL